MQLIVQNLSYTLPTGDTLFADLSFSVDRHQRAALIGDNGTGKSTLLKILAGEIAPSSGAVIRPDLSWFVPQHFGHFDHLCIADALKVGHKLEALSRITQGSSDPQDYAILDDDWAIEENVRAALRRWSIPHEDLSLSLGSLSGGQKTKVFLAGIDIHQPDLILLDEPTNHLDSCSRAMLLEWLARQRAITLVVSHDRKLLDQCNPILELTSSGIKTYGGDYSFFESQKELELEAISQQVDSTRKSIQEARRARQKTLEKQQRRTTTARRNVKSAGIPRIIRKGLQNRGEESSARLGDVHDRKLEDLGDSLEDLREREQEFHTMQWIIPDSTLHEGKWLVQARNIQFSYADNPPLWNQPLSFNVRSGALVYINGDNGSGKSTLVDIIIGEKTPDSGSISRGEFSTFVLDQDYRLIDRSKTVLEQAQTANEAQLDDAGLKTLLVRHLFFEDDWLKPCRNLSGGEMLRLTLLCLTLRGASTDMLILDEPTNNLDLRNIDVLISAIQGYRGTLVVISHDEHFRDVVREDRDEVVEINL